jgi:DNA-binding SARP family transcriptional activator
LTLLGGFSARQGAQDVTPAPGHPATLVKVLALRGTLTTDQAIDLLWPDVDVTTARQRLRNLLNRIRVQTGDVVERRGDALVLASSVVVDVEQFERAATDALAADEVSRPGLARLALGAYPGELLPADSYEDWAAAPRERLRRRFLALVDQAAAESLRIGELDEAVRLLDAAITVEPFGEERYVQAAEALLVQGRRAAARDVVQRGLAVMGDLGVTPGPSLAALADL